VTNSDLLAALGPVVEVLEDLGVRYYVGGSVAGSVHGVPRASIDADVIAELRLAHLARFVERLRHAYYVDLDRARSAVERRGSFNLIHLGTSFKVDLFVAKERHFDRQALERARPEDLEGGGEGPRFRVASPEDTVLAKLEWFRAGGESSERQWADVVGLLTAGRATLDQGFLDRWAVELGVSDLLERARAEVAPES
jgi:hypothetical protein